MLSPGFLIFSVYRKHKTKQKNLVFIPQESPFCNLLSRWENRSAQPHRAPRPGPHRGPHSGPGIQTNSPRPTRGGRDGPGDSGKRVEGGGAAGARALLTAPEFRVYTGLSVLSPSPCRGCLRGGAGGSLCRMTIRGPAPAPPRLRPPTSKLRKKQTPPRRRRAKSA